MNNCVAWAGLLLAAATVQAAQEARISAPAKIISVQRIWDRAGHNAFTDLVRWRGRWWCVFRESAAHVRGDGAIRVIVSEQGQKWESAALLTEPGVDLRDPKLGVTPDGRLMLNCGGSVYLGTRDIKGRRSRMFVSNDGHEWERPMKIGAEREWLWRVTWHEGMAYTAGYTATSIFKHGAADTSAEPAAEWVLTLYKSADGRQWTAIAPLAVPGQPNETTLRFTPAGDLVAMVRREAGNQMGVVGVAAPPYTQWAWRETRYRFGGPNFIILDNGAILACTRDYLPTEGQARPERRTVVFSMRPDGHMTPIATLPSGGDCSYAGLVWHDGRLWVSYYSSHEGKAAIYLATLRPDTPSP